MFVVNVNLFKYFAAQNGDKMKDIALALGKTVATISGNLHGKKGDFTRSEIALLKERWLLTDEQCIQIFFS